MYLAQRIAPLIRAGYTNINGPTHHTENLVSAVGFECVSLISFGRLRLLLPFYLVGLPAMDFGIDDFTDKRVIATHPLGRQFGPFLQ
ncbi:hypothetical protein B0H13DRAFT_2369561 [Mycena leptocephala]|nr:hypothetical protein B0H13DRAFT_2369561 [Mycena leptocephala]